jgi:hypothetical protein
MDRTPPAVRQARALCAIAAEAVESAKDCIARSHDLQALARRTRANLVCKVPPKSKQP